MIYFIPLAAPAALLLAALISVVGPQRQTRLFTMLIEGFAVFAVVCAALTVALLIHFGASTSPLLGIHDIGMSIRLDVVSAAMLLLVSFVGWVVVRYSTVYLDGETRQGTFMAWLCSTLATVMMLVVAGNLVQLVLAWVITSLCLHQLLLFYPERVAARRAARKKFVTARVADMALIGAAVLMAVNFGTTDIATILKAAGSADGGGFPYVTAGLIAVAALLKSAQFPFHGWLTEVMEAPTPVSALLHAGVINAGGFVLIRFADVMLLAPGVLAALVMIGGFTALFGGLVMLTQPAVKTSLAWSTVAQMGFMIMQCGLALFPLAFLHIIAHSLYKAHSFLASGGAVERIAAIRRPGPVAIPNAKAVSRAFLAALALYGLMGWAFGFHQKSPQAIALGTILIFGVAYLLAQGLADAAPRALTKRMAVYSIATSLGYFTLHNLAFRLTLGTLPPTPAPDPLEWVLMALTVLSFGLVAISQAMFPLWANHPAAAGLRVHLSNGLYANALFDGWLGGWSLRRLS